MMALFSKGCIAGSSFNKCLLNIVKYEVLFQRTIVKRKYPVNPEDEQKLPGYLLFPILEHVSGEFFMYTHLQPSWIAILTGSNPRWLKMGVHKKIHPKHVPKLEKYPVELVNDHLVYVWGLAEHGALGFQKQTRTREKTPVHINHPVRHPFAHHHQVTDVACGYGFTVFAVHTKEKYKLFGCGINTDSQIGYHDPRRDHALGLVLVPAPIEIPLKSQSTQFTSVSVGRAHLVALTDNEGAFSIGNNAYGQCGRRIVDGEQYSSNRTVHNIPKLDNQRITAVHCGQDHSLFITEHGQVYSCGWGADGQLGLGHYQTEWKPTRVGGDILSERIVKVTGFGDCVLALSEKGEVFGWGNNEYKQLCSLGDDQQICNPVALTSLKPYGRITDIAAGGSFTMVLNEDNRVFVWGYGILGFGPNVQKATTPTEIPQTLFGQNMYMTNSKVVSIASGLYHMAAITNYGHLYMWGHNKGGCLGFGHVKSQFFPLKVSVGANVLKVSAGVDHTAALCKPFS